MINSNIIDSWSETSQSNKCASYSQSRGGGKINYAVANGRSRSKSRMFSFRNTTLFNDLLKRQMILF